MDTLTSVDLLGFFVVLLALCGLITSIGSAATMIGKFIGLVRKPTDEAAQQLEAHENKFDEYDARLTVYEEALHRDKLRLDESEERDRLMVRGIMQLMTHAIDGNHVDELRTARDDMQSYLINK